MRSGALALSGALKNNSNLTSLNLSGNYPITFNSYDGRVTALIAELIANSSLTSLNLGKSQCFQLDKNIEAFVPALKSNTSLTSLDFSGDCIADVEIATLAPVLTVNATLQSLDLSGNQITDVGVSPLAIALITNSNLRSLDLSGNRITNTGVISLAAALEVNSSLTSLNLSANLITDVGAAVLIQLLNRNFSLIRPFFRERGLMREHSAQQLNSLISRNEEIFEKRNDRLFQLCFKECVKYHFYNQCDTVFRNRVYQRIWHLLGGPEGKAKERELWGMQNVFRVWSKFERTFEVSGFTMNQAFVQGISGLERRITPKRRLIEEQSQ